MNVRTNKFISYSSVVLFFTGLLSSMMIINFHYVYIYRIMAFIIVVSFALITTKIYILNDKSFNIMVILLCLTTILAVESSMDNVWRKNSIIYTFWFWVICIAYSYLQKISNARNLMGYIKGFKIACIIQIIWSFAQIIFFNTMGLDINDKIFNQLLGMVTQSSTYRDGIVVSSGLCWHPANLIPILIISYCFFDKWYMKVILLVVGILSKNSTSILSLVLCFSAEEVIVFRNYFKSKKIILSKNKIFAILSAFMLIVIMLLVKKNSFTYVFSSINQLITRIMYAVAGVGGDTSTSAHVRYYTALPEVWKNSSIFQILFGYGAECSGYPYSVLFHQYTSIGAWVTESDYINFIVGRGIIWTIIFYAWLISIAIKGSKLNKKYLICILTFMVVGITYNIQFEWVIVFEVILAISVRKGIDFWNVNRRELRGGGVNKVGMQ